MRTVPTAARGVVTGPAQHLARHRRGCPVIRWLYERITGKPYYTVRSAAAELGPPPAAQYPELRSYSAGELIRRGRDELLAEIRQRREALARHRGVAR